MEKKLKKILIAVSIFLVAGIIMGIMAFCSANDRQKGANTNARDTGPAQITNKPLIIWFHNAASAGPQVLEKALSSGIITHVLILYLNPQDRPLSKADNARMAIKVCKKHNVKVIWARTLWPSYGEYIDGIHTAENFPRAKMFTPSYYEDIIEQVRQEARVLGAEFTGIDTEAYAYFPFNRELKKRFSKEDFDAMKDAVEKAVEEKGQLDFVLPAAYVAPTHPYNALIQLGKLKIAEHTYYNIPSLHNDKRRPYDVFGAYVNTTTKNPKYSDRPYFTPKEILERQDLWAHKKGLMLYPNDSERLQVAEMLSRIAFIEPNMPSK